jgi:hypothetical protein
MDTDHVYNSVQWMNFQLLTLIHSNLKTNPAATAYSFRLTKEQCTRLLKMSYTDIQTFATNMTGESLFLPRDNLLQLLDAPAGLASILSAVRKSVPSSMPPGTRMESGITFSS